MKPIQWLLVGGPHHGRTVWITYGGKVLDINCKDGTQLQVRLPKKA
jgi:hypothetical protein